MHKGREEPGVRDVQEGRREEEVHAGAESSQDRELHGERDEDGPSAVPG